jgi:hypothetical protein
MKCFITEENEFYREIDETSSQIDDQCLDEVFEIDNYNLR